MLSFLREMLQCPACGGELEWRIEVQTGERIERGAAHCRACQASYPVEDGIAVFLTPDLPRRDLWEESSSGLSGWLAQHSDIERLLMGAPLDTLSPADGFYRALVLEERGQFVQAQAIFATVNSRLYTPEYSICWESQVHYVLDHLSAGSGPVVDLACGRGELLAHVARQLPLRPVVGTDFSLRVLRQDLRRLREFGLESHLSLVACDARRTPFQDGAIETLTTNLGLANIEAVGAALQELRRCTDGEFLAISHFYPEEDTANHAMIAELGLSDSLYRSRLLGLFAAAGWDVLPANICQGQALPTPPGQVLGGASIDTLPVADTELEWATLIAH